MRFFLSFFRFCFVLFRFVSFRFVFCFFAVDGRFSARNDRFLVLAFLIGGALAAGGAGRAGGGGGQGTELESACCCFFVFFISFAGLGRQGRARPRGGVQTATTVVLAGERVFCDGV